VQDKNAVVEGALYDISDSDMSKLDKYEGFPNHYDRIKVKVETDLGKVDNAVTYIAKPDKTAEGLKPNKCYLDHLLVAKDILSENYYRRLTEWETLD